MQSEKFECGQLVKVKEFYHKLQEWEKLDRWYKDEISTLFGKRLKIHLLGKNSYFMESATVMLFDSKDRLASNYFIPLVFLEPLESVWPPEKCKNELTIENLPEELIEQIKKEERERIFSLIKNQLIGDI